MTKKDDVTKLFWLDMEMSGLDVDKEVPIEIAAIVTGWDFKPIAQYHAVIQQPIEFIKGMDPWNAKHHKESGLLDLIPNGKKSELVDQEVADFIAQHFAGERAILAGNSINQDRLFIRKYLPKIEALLHYRMLDVTSWKVVFNELWQRKFKKKDGHRALEDILESIEEFKYYISFVKPN